MKLWIMHTPLFMDNCYNKADDERLRVIASFNLDAADVLGKLEEAIESDEVLQDLFKFISMNSRIAQFSLMMDLLTEVIGSQGDINFPIAPVDELLLQTLVEEWSQEMGEYYLQNDEEFQEAILSGMKSSFEDLKDILIPEDVVGQDTVLRDVHFMPWKRNFLNDKYPNLTKHKDGEFTRTLSTRLPSIYVVHAYPPGINALPVETICYNTSSSI